MKTVQSPTTVMKRSYEIVRLPQSLPIQQCQGTRQLLITTQSPCVHSTCPRKVSGKYLVGLTGTMHVDRMTSERVLSARVRFQWAAPATELPKVPLEQDGFSRLGNIRVSFRYIRRWESLVNYGSMYIPPGFSKMLEWGAFAVLLQHAKPALSKRQHDFMPGRLSTTNLCTWLHTAWSNTSPGSQTGVICTEYSSAFQGINHKVLIHKLNQFCHISNQVFRRCESYLSGRG